MPEGTPPTGAGPTTAGAPLDMDLDDQGMHTPRGDLLSEGSDLADPWDASEPVYTYHPGSQVTGITDQQASRLRSLETDQAALRATVANLDGAVAAMADDQKALRQQCDNLEQGINTIAGTQHTLSDDLKGFMQQLGPLISLAHQQAANPLATGGSPPPAAPTATPLTPAAAPPTGPSSAAGGAEEVAVAPDAGSTFAPVRQSPTGHGGPYASR